MNKYKYCLSSIKIIPFILLLTYAFPVFAKTIKFSNSPRLNIELKTMYNDNIFLYSDAYISDFVNQVRPFRFPFNTYDDFITNLNLQLQFPVQKDINKSYLNLFYKQYLFAMNGEKSYQIVSATFNQSLSKRFGFDVSYLFLPRYLIRFYQNPFSASIDYIGCTFAEHLLTIRLNYKWRSINVKPFGRFEIDKYKENFSFYDGKASRFGMDLIWLITSSINLAAGVERKQNQTQGPVPDISYNENQLNGQINVKLPDIEKLLLNFGTNYIARDYTTNNSALVDPFHKDRSDKTINLNGGVEYRIASNLRINFVYEHEIRRTSSPYRSQIEDIKDYDNNIFTLGLRYSMSNIFQGE